MEQVQSKVQPLQIQTQFCRNIQIPKYNLEYAKKGFSYSALKTLNEIPLSTRELPTLFHFKKQLKMYLMS